jgi:hypothetical protein
MFPWTAHMIVFMCYCKEIIFTGPALFEAIVVLSSTAKSTSDPTPAENKTGCLLELQTKLFCLML